MPMRAAVLAGPGVPAGEPAARIRLMDECVKNGFGQHVTDYSPSEVHFYH